MSNNVLFAFTLTMIAGLSTGIGSCIAFFAKKTNTKFLSVSLGFSAGVMIYVSLVEIFQKAKASLSQSYGDKSGTLITIAAFFAGMLLIGLVDRLLPSEDNPHEVKRVESMAGQAAPVPHDCAHTPHNSAPVPHDCAHKAAGQAKAKLMRTGLFTALAIGLHNFPEGLATFIAALHNPTIAIPIVVAIAIHNIPEGIAVSVPIYYATGSKKKAFLYSFASGLSEPVGALIGYLLLLPIMSETVYGILFALVAGIMVFISLDELLPSAREYGEHHLSIYGLVSGMALMALSLWLFM